jgi:hypothetical protein
MNRISTFASDLVQDLRDRNLLIPAIALLVAIVAVPILLGGGGSDAGTAAPAAEVAPVEGAEEIDPVVLAEAPGIRDYRKRLTGKERNPFIQISEASSEAAGSGGNGSGGGSGGGGSTSTGTDDATSAPPVDDSGSSTAPPSDTPDEVHTETRKIVFTVDVRVRHDGESRVIEGAEAMALLPGKQRPIVQYLGADVDGERAGFVVAPAVVSAEGDGNCDPGRNDCQFLSMRAGDSQTFLYGEDERKFRLDLLAIHRVVTKTSETTDSTG